MESHLRPRVEHSAQFNVIDVVGARDREQHAHAIQMRLTVMVGLHMFGHESNPQGIRNGIHCSHDAIAHFAQCDKIQRRILQAILSSEHAYQHLGMGSEWDSDE